MLQRTSIADVLKGIAVVLMIQVHILEVFAASEIIHSSKGSFLLFLGGPLIAPVFAAVFGYFVILSKRNTKQLILRGFKIFILGMGLNLALNFNLLIHIYNGAFDLDSKPYLFGADFLQFAGLSIIFIALLKQILSRSILATIGLCFLISFLGQFLLQFQIENETLKYIGAFFYGNSTWSYFPLFPWLAYPLFGVLVFQLQQKLNFENLLKPTIKLTLGITFVIFLIFTIHYGIDIASNLQEYYHHGIVFFIWTSIFLLFYSFTISLVDKVFGNTTLFRYLKWLGKNVTAVYIIQWILIGNMGTEIYKSISNPLILVFSFLGILSATTLFIFLYIKIRNYLN